MNIEHMTFRYLRLQCALSGIPLVVSLGAIPACSGSDSGSTLAVGGDTSQAGSGNGGGPSLGGLGSQGGAPSTGGVIGNGGTPATGGAVSTAGKASTGGSVTAPTGGSTSQGGANATGGSPSTGGIKATGGSPITGGAAATGGAKATGGTPNTGGTSSAGGAKASGGAPSSGGSTTKATGGSPSTGGAKTTGGTTSAGDSGNCPAPNPRLFAIGADITDQEVAPVATRANLLSIMKSHGFNYIRLRTFVDPKASDGYDKTNGYDDITHTVDFGKQIKDACMGLLVDFHYSDNWADPGKQCVPIAWQGYTTIADLATAVHDYTKDAITKLIAGGARPDMVQIGNETTPGMLLHRCDSSGQPTGSNPVTGSTSNWANLGALFKAGIQGVKDVDPTILISLHIDRGNDLTSSRNYINNAQNQGVKFDAFGESCYTAYQGQPSAWQSTFTALSTAFPAIKFFIAEYGPEQRAANDIIFNLPNDQGIGTFNWEPTTQGAWNTGHDLLRRNGTTYTAQPDLALYDQMKIDYASRL